MWSKFSTDLLSLLGLLSFHCSNETEGGGMDLGKGEGVRPGLLRKEGVGEKGVVEYRWSRGFFFFFSQT